MKTGFIPMLMIFLISIIFLGGCIGDNGQNGPLSGEGRPSSSGTTPVSGSDNIVEITASGFSPQTLTINSGETVTFVNKDNQAHWPASNVHPTHGTYPESGGCIGSAFDACRGLERGESYSFTFNHKGSWSYHDHWNPGITGTIVVQ